MDAQEQTVTSPTPSRRGKKLDLVKCDRCRVDKQKCTPTTRVWPTKCDRCTKKGFSCSLGRRVVRKTKQVVSDVNAARNGESSPGKAWDTLIFLVGYHGILTQTLDRVGDVRRATVQPFVESWNSDDSLHRTPLDIERDMTENINDVLNYIIRLREEIPPLVVSTKIAQTIIIPFTSQTSLFRPLPGSCLFCNESEEQGEILGELHDRYLLCSEYQLRQTRFVEVLRIRNHVSSHHGKDAKELGRLRALWQSIQDQAESIADELDGPQITSEGAAFVPDEIALYEAWLGWTESEGESVDVLGRTRAHQWLDASPLVVHRQWLLNHIHKHIEAAEHLAHQDSLGRTLLHLACMKNWEDGVQELLHHGAEAGARTVYGSLPLHYAAANGSITICKMLLVVSEKYDVYAKDEAGMTAREYAIKNGNTMIADMLRERTAKERSPNMRIIEKADWGLDALHGTAPSAFEVDETAAVPPHDAIPKISAIYGNPWVPIPRSLPDSFNAETPHGFVELDHSYDHSIQTTPSNVALAPVANISSGVQISHVLQGSKLPDHYLQSWRPEWREER